MSGKIESRSGDTISIQLTKFGLITDLDSDDFELIVHVGTNTKERFLIKNQTLFCQTIEVIPAGQDGDDWVETVIEPGWNPEWVRKVKTNADAAGSLLWGY